jgi:hypothetical protein
MTVRVAMTKTTLLYCFLASVIWFAVATVNCGGALVCLAIAFLPGLWLMVVACAAFMEGLARQLSARWSPLLFLVFALAGFGLLIVNLLYGRAPFLFSDPQQAKVFWLMDLWPAASVLAFFEAVSILRWVQGRQANPQEPS